MNQSLLIPKYLKELNNQFIVRANSFYEKLDQQKAIHDIKKINKEIKNELSNTVYSKSQVGLINNLARIFDNFNNKDIDEFILKITTWINKNKSNTCFREIINSLELLLSSLKSSINPFKDISIQVTDSKIRLSEILEKSILAGEYISFNETTISFEEYANNCIRHLEIIENHLMYLNTQYSFLLRRENYPDWDERDKEYTKSIWKPVIDFLPLAINAYKRVFIAIINNHLKKDLNIAHFQPFIPVEEIHYVLSKYPVFNLNDYDLPDIILCRLYILIYLAEIDLYPTTTDGTIYNLERFHTFVRNYKNDDHLLKKDKHGDASKIIKDKIEYLLYKINLRKAKDRLRLKHEESDKFDQICDYSELNNQISIFVSNQGEDINEQENHTFFELLNKTQKHYINNYKELKKSFNIINNLGEKYEEQEVIHATNNIENFHHSSKYFSKIKDSETLKTLLEKVKKYRQAIEISPDIIDCQSKKSWQYTQNLIQNKIWKLKIENLNKNKDELIKAFLKDGIKSIREILEDIKEQQGEQNINIPDYYPYLSLIIFMDDLIEEMRKDAKKFMTEEYRKDIGDNKFVLETKLNEIENKITEFKTLYKETLRLFNSKLDDYRNWHSRQIVLPLHSSIVKGTSATDLEIYLNSSYVIPIDFKGLKERWSNAYSQARGSFRSLSNRVIIDLQTDFFTRNYQKELESREFRAVQVLAMFISVATLILGTVKIFENRGLIPSLIILIGFGIVLLIFNYFFYWFSKRVPQDFSEKYSNEKSKKWIILLSPYRLEKLLLNDTSIIHKKEGRDYMERRLRKLIFSFSLSLFLGIAGMAYLTIYHTDIAEKMDIGHKDSNQLKNELYDSVIKKVDSSNIINGTNSFIISIEKDSTLKNKLKKLLLK